MGKTIIRFDNKSLVISKEDFEIFKKEKYHIDDGTTHIFYDKDLCLLVIGVDSKPRMAIYFSPIFLDGEEMYEISQINHCYNNQVNQNNLNKIRKDILSCVQEAFALLDNILQKRAKDNDKITSLGYKYCIHDIKNHMHNTSISLFERFSYLKFMPELDYAFCFID